MSRALSPDLADGSVFELRLPEGAETPLRWQGLRGDSLGLAIAEASLQNRNRTIVVITSESLVAQRVCDQLAFFLGNRDVIPWLLLPDWECLPYDNVSPHQFLISQRLRALHRIPYLQPGIVVLPVTSLIQRLPPRSFVEGNTLILEVGDHLEVESL
ncbi:MAG: transcription-repair coupling factor, partial [Gammaproteobacteria bacterium]|nr:transcription-repair coupling factor [Gammaproteobacteria bacterium]